METQSDSQPSIRLVPFRKVERLESSNFSLSEEEKHHVHFLLNGGWILELYEGTNLRSHKYLLETFGNHLTARGHAAALARALRKRGWGLRIGARYTPSDTMGSPPAKHPAHM